MLASKHLLKKTLPQFSQSDGGPLWGCRSLNGPSGAVPLFKNKKIVAYKKWTLKKTQSASLFATRALLKHVSIKATITPWP